MRNLKSVNIAFVLKARELGGKLNTQQSIAGKIRQRTDDLCNHIATTTQTLREAIECKSSNRWKEIERAVEILIQRLLDNSNPDQVFVITPTKKQEREIFVSLGGVDLLLKLFNKPFGNVDGLQFQARSELWNEILVILREVAFAIPTLSENVFGKNHITFLFTLLKHQSVFENTMNLLEEILAVRVETFSLALIPNFYDLVASLSTRHLAHFCRVLSLVLFEPEDRQIMEGSHVLRSLELLQLRRDRMAKVSNIVERNQSLVIEMPNLLSRLVQILRIINYGPSLADLIRYNIIAQTPISSDLLSFFNSSQGVDWQRFDQLDRIVSDDNGSRARQRLDEDGVDSGSAGAGGGAGVARSGGASSARRRENQDSTSASASNGQGRAGSDPSSTAGSSVSSSSSSSSSSRSSRAPPPSAPPSSVGTTEGDLEGDIMNELLAAFAPSAGRSMDMSSLINIVYIAESLGIASLTEQGAQLYHETHGHNDPMAAMGMMGRGAGRRGRNARRSPALPAPPEARKELQFHAMLLAPHQVELLFVLCTLLSGRRKIDVQRQLAGLGLADILVRMFDRMSWEAPPFTGPNPLEHMHGPGCECNPESALRVQFLRLVHNFYDRDFLGNTNKALMLTPHERDLLAQPLGDVSEALFIPSQHRGLLSRITAVLQKEAADSVYRFWLSSCLEAFLRGSGQREQVFVARAGVLAHTTMHIVDMGLRPSSNLQTAFDLLGELIKGNSITLQMIEMSLSDRQFRLFMDVVMSNLVDSNVFLRSLYLSMDTISDRMVMTKAKPSKAHKGGVIASSEHDPDPGAGGESNPDSPSEPELDATVRTETPSPPVTVAAGATSSTPETTPAPAVGSVSFEGDPRHFVEGLGEDADAAYARGAGAVVARGVTGATYLTQSWVQFAPASLLQSKGKGQFSLEGKGRSRPGSRPEGQCSVDGAQKSDKVNLNHALQSHVHGSTEGSPVIAVSGVGRAFIPMAAVRDTESSSSAALSSASVDAMRPSLSLSSPTARSFGATASTPTSTPTSRGGFSGALENIRSVATAATQFLTGTTIAASPKSAPTEGAHRSHIGADVTRSEDIGAGIFDEDVEDMSVFMTPPEFPRYGYAGQGQGNSHSTSTGTMIAGDDMGADCVGDLGVGGSRGARDAAAAEATAALAHDLADLSLRVRTPRAPASTSGESDATPGPLLESSAHSSNSPPTASSSTASLLSLGMKAVSLSAHSDGDGDLSDENDLLSASLEFMDPTGSGLGSGPCSSKSSSMNSIADAVGAASRSPPSPPLTPQSHTPLWSQSAVRENELDGTPLPSSFSLESSPGVTSGGWTLPDGLFRLSMFLTQERDRILLKLMTIVTIRTINHENICCLNTALLLLILAHKRGNLGRVLRNVRRLAEVEGPVHQRASRLRRAEERREAQALDFAFGGEGGPEVDDSDEDVDDEDDAEGDSPNAGDGDLDVVGEDVDADTFFDTDPTRQRSTLRGESGDAGGDGDGDEATDSVFCGACAPTSAPAEQLVAPTKADRPPLAQKLQPQQQRTRATACRGCGDPMRCRSLGGSMSPLSPTSPVDPTMTDVTKPSNQLKQKSSRGGASGEAGGGGSRNRTSHHGDKVMKNFRALLWYWQEYYLRRGRDRLSIEFSSHVPFHVWRELVDILCRDDGAVTSLLPAPVALPRSPYCRPSRGHTSASADIILFVN